jgi:LmbE family N-acetylglucosaminyl deacetylase
MDEQFESRFVPYQASMMAGQGRALIFAPHPDDEVIGCGGAVIRHLDKKDPVRVVVFTDGRLGDPFLSQKYTNHQITQQKIQAYVEIRKQESRLAAEFLGYDAPDFMEIPDRQLTHNEHLIGMIQFQIKSFKPNVIYLPSIYEMHPDHRGLAMAVLDVVIDRLPKCDLFMYEIGRPIPSPDCLIDITDIWERKLSAVKCFKSQLAVSPYDEYITSLNHFRSFTLPVSVKRAEAYLVSKSGDVSRIMKLRQLEIEDRKK